MEWRLGRFDIVKLVLEDSRVAPAIMDNWPIGWACRNGHIDIVNLLLQDPRVNPDTEDQFALRTACIRGHVEIVKILLQDPRIDSRNVLVEYNNINAIKEEIKELLKQHAYKPDSHRYNNSLTHMNLLTSERSD